MKKLYLVVLFTSFFSCISLRKAPEYFTYKLEVAKKFKRQFPKEIAYIFEDPKAANQFYQYIDKKYRLNDSNVGINVPIVIDNKTFYFTYYEAEIPDKKLNLLGLAIDTARAANDKDPIFTNGYVKRQGHWFLALTVYDEKDNNCLNKTNSDRKIVLDYLKLLQNEYLNSHSL
ncbi:hypothetical protein [uncultured Winogradskyella sp.]|uniref:hypothetical protein n=1 Tax=Winogradskyella sp. 4-2091 TaxID=3381659 RepID=UPI00261B09B0|nr:hypothetical protein [uncultured Winogradskyella sp.]